MPPVECCGASFVFQGNLWWEPLCHPRRPSRVSSRKEFSPTPPPWTQIFISYSNELIPFSKEQPERGLSVKDKIITKYKSRFLNFLYFPITFDTVDQSLFWNSILSVWEPAFLAVFLTWKLIYQLFLLLLLLFSWGVILKIHPHSSHFLYCF